MSRIIKNLLKNTAANLPGLRERYFQWEFMRRSLVYKGIYASFDEAIAHAPRAKLAGYDHPEIATMSEGTLEELNPADYPVLFWLGSLLEKTESVFDLGGNLGVAWYAYRHYLAFPPQLRWTVCDVPATVTAGRALAERRRETQLAFTDRREEADGADVYLTCGALQYIEQPLVDALQKLRDPPPHLLVNRVPLTDGPAFITLQNCGLWTSPYKVQNRATFLDGLASLGYELDDAWKLARSVEVLGSPQHRAENYHGMYFRRLSS